MNSKVSIIVPVYNVEKFLEQCVNSILSQTYRNLEVILVDDGSPDKCPQMCDDYAARDQRIKVVHKRNGGLSSARNAGLDVATGEYVMFIDSDDFIDNNTVEYLLAVKENCNADIVCYGMFRYNGTNDTLIENTVSKKDLEILDQLTTLKKLILRTIDCSSCNKLYERNKIGTLRFKVGRNNEDHPFLFELYQRCNSIAYTNKAHYHYRITPGSITNSLNERSFDIFKNTDDIESIIKERNLDLRKEFDLAKIWINIEFARSIQKNKKQREFSSRYNKFRKVVRDNYIKIIFSSYFSIKSKLTATYLLFIY